VGACRTHGLGSADDLLEDRAIDWLVSERVTKGEIRAADAEIEHRFEDLPKALTRCQAAQMACRRKRRMNREIRRVYFRSLHRPWDMPKWEGTDQQGAWKAGQHGN
jgi:hypothetical protein